MKMRSLLLMALILAGTAAAVRAQTPFFAVSQDDFYPVITNAADLERPLIDGILRKTDDSVLTLRNPRIPRGEFNVQAGSINLSFTNAFSAPALPDALRQKASFWVDANTNVVTDGSGKVERWHDVREPSVTGPVFQYMMATNDVAFRRPAVVADPALDGKKYLDFGSWGGTLYSNDNARFLFMSTSNGILRTSFALRTVFIVFGSHNAWGAGGSMCLIQNATSLTPESAPWAGDNTRLWIGANANVIADDGLNWLDRTMLHGWNVQVKDKAYHMINVTTRIPARANTFGYDRGLLGYSGGARICEALFFTDELTDAERLQAEDYLWHKWFARNDPDAGAFKLADSTVANLDLDANPYTAAVAGAGTVNKTGAGTLRLRNDGTETFDGTARLREGGLLTAGHPYLLDIEEGGQTLAVNGPVTQRTADGQPADIVSKTGAGELAVASIAPSVARVSVAEGTLRLAVPYAPAAPLPVDAAVNCPSLEAFTNGVTSATQLLNYTPLGGPHTATVNGWFFDRSAYPSSGNFLIGIVFDACTVPLVAQPFPDGNAALYINCGTVSTSFNVANAGYYRLLFHVAARDAGTSKRNVNVQLDGTTLHTVTAATPFYWQYAVRLPWLAAGSHTIGFQGFGADYSKVAIVDNIRVETLSVADAETVTAPLANGGLEMPAAWMDLGITVSNSATAWSDGAWTFENFAGLGRIQTVEYSRSMPPSVPEGFAAGILTTNGVIRQTVTFPQAGQYRLSFAAAGRVALINHSFDVRLDGSVLKTFTTHDTRFRQEEILLPPVTAGQSLELAFVGVTHVNATASLIDDVRIERISDTLPDALSNGGFEAGAAGWTFTSLAGVTNNTNPWKVPVLAGTNMAYLSMKNSFSQQVSFAQGGSYMLRFQSQSYGYTEFDRYHDFDVLWDGQLIGRFLNVSLWPYRFAVPLPPVGAGSVHTLQITGVDSYGVNSGSCFDAFRIEPYTPRERLNLAGRFPETTVLDIASGAKLALDFEGEIIVRTIRYAGQTVSGTISAATHPEFVTGTGSIASPAKGTLISLH